MSTTPAHLRPARRLSTQRRGFRSLLVQLLVVFILATVLPLVVALVQAWSSRASAEERAASDLQRAASAAALHTASLLEDARGTARILERTPPLWTGTDEDRDWILSAFAASGSLFDILAFATPDLQQHGSSAQVPGRERPNIAIRAYARDAVATGEMQVAAESAPALTTGRTVLPIAIPLRRNGEDPPAGLLVAALNVDRLPELWEEVPLSGGGTIMLVDIREGRVLTASGRRRALIGQPLVPENLDRLRDGNLVGWIDTSVGNGGRQLRAAAVIEGTPWMIVVDMPADAVSSALRQELSPAVAVALTVGIVTVIALLLAWRRLAERLGRLQRSAARWAAGEWTHRSGVAGSDELGMLGSAFDSMATQLEFGVRELETQRDFALQVLRTMGQGLTVIDTTGNLEYVNQAFATMLGYEPDELAGRHVEQLIAPEDTQVLDDARAARNAGHGSQYEIRLVHANGSRVPVLVTGVPRASRGQARQGAIVVYTDLSERIRTEETLRRKEEQYKHLVDAATDIVYRTDPRGRFTFVNPRGIETFGYDLDELIGRSYLQLVRPDRRDTVRRFYVEQLVNKVPNTYLEFPALTRTNEEVWVGQNVQLVFEGNNVVGWQSFARDLTERHRAEEALERLRRRNELILDAVGDGLLGQDNAGRITFSNPAATRLVGWTGDEMAGQRLHALLHHSHLDGSPFVAEECELHAAVTEGREYRSATQTFWRKDGSSFPVEVVNTPIIEHGRTVGSVVAFRDITERLAVEKMKDEFVSVVSHELRTPLTSIRGSLGLLRGGLLTSDPNRSQRMLEIAISNTDRLIRLINEILDIERMQSGRVSMQKTLTDAGELAAHAAELMRGMANRNGITIEVVATAVRLWADPDRILQVLTNLLSNAIKFSPSHGVVRLEVDAEERDVLLRVCDRGRGIPPDKLDSVFERFQQVDASDSRQKGGTGLGLAISRTIVMQHGGQIWAESTLGEGTTMSVRLPRLTDAPVLPSSSLRGAATILVCDDDPSVLEVVGTMLQRRGYRVVLAGSGHEALQRAREQKPTLILLDLLMPGQHSMELIEAFKEEPVTAKVPIVIFSVLSPGEGSVDPRSIADWVCRSLDDEGTLMRAIVRMLGEPSPSTSLTGTSG